MRSLILSATALGLTLSGCAKPVLALSDDPRTRAAQCAVVATVSARVAIKDPKGHLPFDAQGRALHPALLAGVEGDGYDPAATAAVLKRLAEVEPAITSGKWQALVPACAAAYPDAAGPVELPEAPLDAQLGCSLIADFLGRTLQSQEANYVAELEPARAMRAKLDNRIGAKLANAGQTDRDDQKGARSRAMAGIVRAGSPGPVLAACVKRFG